MMTYEEFMDYVKTNVASYLPEDITVIDVDIWQYVKNNDVAFDGLNIYALHSNISPNIYLNPFYDQYTNGRNLDEIMKEIAYTYVKNRNPKNNSFLENIHDLDNFDIVKDNIFPKLVNLEKNKSRLKDVPYTQVEDLAITYHIKVSMDSNSMSSLMIKNDRLSAYGISKEELHSLAMANMKRMFQPLFKTLYDATIDMVVKEIVKQRGLTQDEAREYAKDMMPNDMNGLYYLSNNCNTNGSIWIIDEETQKMIAEKVGGDYYIIPSSVHEILIVPKDYDITLEGYDINEMVEYVNTETVDADEVLSDHAYEYNVATHTFRACPIE